MKLSWIEHFKHPRSRSFIRWIGTGAILALVLIFLFVFSFGRILDTDLVKKFLASKVFIYTDLEIEYSNVDSIVFPLPGFLVEDLVVSSGGEEILRVQSVELIWNSYALLFGDFELTRVYIRNGSLRLHRNSQGTLQYLDKINSKKLDEDTEEFRKQQLEGSSPDAILEWIPIIGKVENFHIQYKDDVLDREDFLAINQLSYQLNPSRRSLSVNWNLDGNGANWVLNGDISLEENSWEKENLRLRIQSKLTDVTLRPYKEFLSVFPEGNFDEAVLSLDCGLYKEDSVNYRTEIENLSILGLVDKNKKNYPVLSLRTDLTWNSETLGVQVRSLQLEIQDKSEVQIQGEYTKNQLVLDLMGEKFHLKSTLGLVRIFTPESIQKEKGNKQGLNASGLKQTPNHTSHDVKTIKASEESFQLTLNIHLKNLNLNGTLLQSIRGKVHTHDDKILWENLGIRLYGGNVVLNGSLDPKMSGNNLRSNIKIQGVNSEYLIESIAKQKLLKGDLNGGVYLTSRVGGGSNFLNSMYLESNLTIRNGELLGYANFIRPVAEIGKLVNFQSNSGGKSTEFKLITTKAKVLNQVLYLEEFRMDGVGIDAKGSGKYSIREDKMDMKFQASLPGVAGKVLKIPIIYKGVLGKNLAYLDPIWLASVYAGSIFLAGPAGAVVGGLTGSLASDTVDKTTETVKDGWNSAKDFIFGKKDKKKEPSKGK